MTSLRGGHPTAAASASFPAAPPRDGSTLPLSRHQPGKGLPPGIESNSYLIEKQGF
jgi:hypothetical protein